MHENEFDAAVDRAARALLASVKDAGAAPATSSALMDAVQIHANRFDGLLPVEDIEATSAAVAARAHAKFAEAFDRGRKLPEDIREFTLRETAKAIDEGVSAFMDEIYAIAARRRREE